MNLTQLHTLELVSSVTYSPAVLECCTRLQRLVISSPNVHVSDVSVPGAGRAAMMAALPRLQQLQESTITLIGGHGQLWGYPSPEDTSAVASYSALTSSTNLHTLELTGMPMDARALPALFQKGHQLPALHTLILAMSMDTWAPPPATDMQQLVCCCPALRRLHLSHCRVGAELLQPLLQLSCLTELHVPRCDALGDDGGSAMSKVLAQLTQLSHLLVGTGVSDVAITELTALTGLTALCRTGGGFPHDLMMINKAPQHSPPDVAQQLLRLCQVSPECHVRLLQAQVRKQAVQLGERQQQVEALTGQLTAAQQHVERLTQLLAQHGIEEPQGDGMGLQSCGE